MIHICIYSIYRHFVWYGYDMCSYGTGSGNSAQ